MEGSLSAEQHAWLDHPLGHSVYKAPKVDEIEEEAAQVAQRGRTGGKKPKGFRTLFSRKSSPYL